MQRWEEPAGPSDDQTLLRMCGAGIFTVHCGVIVVWLLGCFLFTNQGRFLGAVPRDSRAGADELIAKTCMKTRQWKCMDK